MRTIQILSFSFTPPKLLATVTYVDGQVTIEGTATMREHLEHGVVGTQGRVLPADGDAFMDALYREFSGTYVRAQTV
jgi:hypothetical protein